MFSSTYVVTDTNCRILNLMCYVLLSWLCILVRVTICFSKFINDAVICIYKLRCCHLQGTAIFWLLCQVESSAVTVDSTCANLGPKRTTAVFMWVSCDEIFQSWMLVVAENTALGHGFYVKIYNIQSEIKVTFVIYFVSAFNLATLVWHVMRLCWIKQNLRLDQSDARDDSRSRFSVCLVVAIITCTQCILFVKVVNKDFETKQVGL